MFRKAIIVATNPGDNSVDLILCDDGSRISGVPVLCVGGSARSGSVGLPEIEGSDSGKGGAGGGDKWDITKGRGKQIEAMVGFMGSGNPFVAGFMFPQISQMTFDDKKRSLSRHQSDVYHTTDGEGNTEFYHPSGAYVRIGEKTEHEDLEGKNVDKSFKLDRNKDKKVKMHIQTKDGKGAVTLDPDGTITIKASTKIVLDTPLVSIPNGKLEASGDGTFGGVSVIKHLHTKVMPGPLMSGPPLAGGLSPGGIDGGAGGGDGSGGGGAGGGQSDANTPSSQGNPETAGSYGNGIANDATGVFRAAVQSRVPYQGVPNIAGSGLPVGRFAYAFSKMPVRPELIGAELFYERVRQTGIGIFDGGIYQAVVSEFDQENETWTDDVIDMSKGAENYKAGTYLGDIPHGIQGFDQPGPFDVFVSREGVHYAKYCDWMYVARIDFATVTGIQPIFWKLTPEEVAANFVPNP